MCDMEPLHKLNTIAQHMDLEPIGEPRSYPSPTPAHEVAPCGQVIRSAPPEKRKEIQPKKKKIAMPENNLGVSLAVMPGGKTQRQLKTMLTTACERNCYYCPFRAGRSFRRVTFKPEEMAKLFMKMVAAKEVEGLFLSSGIIKGSVRTQDKLLDTIDIVRNRYRFQGYIHIKVMPGIEKDQLRQAMRIANRLSVNLEGPNEKRLAKLAPKKEFWNELVRPLQWIDEIRREESPHQSWNGRWASSVTQFVVGGVGESDLELLSTSEQMIKRHQLQRVYYSSFRPIEDTPMENLPPSDPLREHRLYQSSFLFRDYGYELEEMPFDQNGNLPLHEDPKIAWAKVNLSHNPVEVNRAELSQLLRIPGIGPLSAKKIISVRRHSRLRELKDLRKLGISTKRAEPYLLLDGQRPLRQLALF